MCTGPEGDLPNLEEVRHLDLRDDDAKWNDWRVAQVVALALEKQANWIVQKKLIGKSTKVEKSESLLSAFAHEMDHKVNPLDFTVIPWC
jgi:hypothetical protein